MVIVVKEDVQDEIQSLVRTFIGVDGEGLTRETGYHDYTLLAASDGSYVENYELGGLSTQNCFDFLCDVSRRNPKSILVAFFANYDCNMMFKDIDLETLAHLYIGDTWTWRSPGNYGYRISYHQNRLLRIRRGAWYFDEETEDNIWKDDGGFTLWDTQGFFQMSFVKALKDWNLCDDATIKRIKDMKDQRGSFEDGQQEEIRSYCFEECRLLAELMSKMGQMLDLAEIDVNQWYGAGAIAAAIFKKYGVKKHIVRPPEGSDLDVAIRCGYFGGRIETFVVGEVTDPVYQYDIRSAYPAEIARLPSMVGTWTETKEYQPGRIAMWRVRWKLPRGSHLAPFPFRFKKSIYWPLDGEGWYHSNEVDAAIRVFGNKIKVLRGLVFTPDEETYPLAFVEELYRLRSEYKRAGDAREKPLKLAYNASYGKFAQSLGSKKDKNGNDVPPAFQCYFWAGRITAGCRAKMLTQAARVPKDELYAIATDAIFCSKLDIDTTDRLGGYEDKEITDGLMFIQPGVYASPSLKVLKTRGFSADTVKKANETTKDTDITYEAVRKLWYDKGMGGAIAYFDTQFIGMGRAMALRKMYLWRTWRAVKKKISFSGTASKVPDFSESLIFGDTQRVYLRPQNKPIGSESSEGYQPTKRTVKGLTEIELLRESIAEQPDFLDNEFSFD